MQLAVFNRNLALDRVGGDEDLLREVAQLFLQEYPSLMGQLEDAVARDDASRVMETAHTMKGSLATLGAEAGTQIAFQLESMGRHRTLEGSHETCRALADQLNELKSELQKVAAGA
ncbi:MAG: Hpt domain-containing protein [Bryobacterales bacterium]|nr:Hpt domain-containing protein [Bryobacterales bacterium]